MIWYQTLLGPLFRFAEDGARELSRAEILRNGNAVRLARAREKFLSALSEKPQSADDIAKKIGTSKSNALGRARRLYEEGVIERIQYNINQGGKKYLWRLKCQSKTCQSANV